jgi:hypothetical protein
MLITSSQSHFPARALKPASVAEANSSTLSAATDRVDFSDPAEWVPVAAYGVAGAFPVVGTFINGMKVLTSDTKAERWASVGATLASIAGPLTLAQGLSTGSLAGIAGGVALTTMAGANFAYQRVKERKADMAYLSSHRSWQPS